MSIIRVNICLDTELLETLDVESSNLHISRSSYISIALSEKLKRDKILRNIIFENKK